MGLVHDAGARLAVDGLDAHHSAQALEACVPSFFSSR
jgi:hypothetical protein